MKNNTSSSNIGFDSWRNTYMIGLDVANHVVGTVQGVTEGVLVRSVMQTFDHTWRRHT